ncbi:Maf family nucleotide pyrophosphatase [Constantimarinum furrinae]|uniref:dTTP/UTP pyrophosphatase n=1 Tax=Constantimarinum furrinae TaxID=2562285 RepID=A0A7G8PW74_9FLAO|nr:Maf family nucleotide pyrophosphatase [Constantimarinum furrinae]QNJ98590.1 septum formation protein Maf [Constantimarinum furrinae]
MLRNTLKDYNIILASGSPRRQKFFKELDVDFSIEVREIEETYPDHLKASAITDYLSQLKATAFPDLSEKDLLITSDTVVWKDNIAIGKPRDTEEARKMLQRLSGAKHQVITSVCFTTISFQKTIHDTTTVWFKELSSAEIDHYLRTYEPFDKAGSYGVQEWIGYIAIERLEGSYFNVMGLPTALVYKTLLEIAGQ